MKNYENFLKKLRERGILEADKHTRKLSLKTIRTTKNPHETHPSTVGNETILVAEDEEIVRTLVSRMLEPESANLM